MSRAKAKGGQFAALAARLKRLQEVAARALVEAVRIDSSIVAFEPDAKAGRGLEYEIAGEISPERLNHEVSGMLAGLSHLLEELSALSAAASARAASAGRKRKRKRSDAEIAAALAHAAKTGEKGVRLRAAEALGLSPRQLQRRMRGMRT